MDSHAYLCRYTKVDAGVSVSTHMNTPEMRRMREELREKTALLRAGGFSRESASKSQSRSKERDPQQSAMPDECK